MTEAAAYQEFLGACRAYWAGAMFRALQRQAAAAAERAQIDPQHARAAYASLVQAHPTHAMFAWFERHLQRMRYSGSWGLVAMAGAQRDALPAPVALPDGLLTLDPDLVPPSYWTDHDIHQHPGGLGGELAGAVYQAATAGGGVVGRPQLHERFAEAALAGRSPRRILDLGCGFGRGPAAFAAAAPQAEVTGIDLSASCLLLAAANTPKDWAGRVTYRQADAASAGLALGSFDLVTSTMLLHELPEAALHALIIETGRLLAPGGTAVHLDFLPPADPLLRILYDGHSERNNEPFMRDLAQADLDGAHRGAGFASFNSEPFAEVEGALDMPARRWRLPWTIITAAKLPEQETKS